MSAPAAFLDRDGTINERAAEHHYIESPDDFRWLDGSIDAIVALSAAGFVPVVISNQRGIARGIVTWETLALIEQKIQRELAARGARIARFVYCPHELDAGCDCRKPLPGMLLKAAADLDLDLQASWMVGDSASDVAAGRAAGCRTALIGEGACDSAPTIRIDSLAQAAREILRMAGRSGIAAPLPSASDGSAVS
jgi:D-glycero-D-manno-heptose 1,7-bisphosphate phosphatase